jgi:hypothetical protein
MIAMRTCTAVALLFAGNAWADGGTSCALAQQLFRNQVYSGDTSTSTNFVGAFGGLPSPGPDLAFKFTGGPGVHGAIAVTITGGWNAGVVVTASCGGNGGNPIAAATGTTSFSVPLTASFTEGQTYYLYVTGNPSDNSGPSGAFSFTGFVPVELQTFSVDYAPSSRFARRNPPQPRAVPAK